MEARKKRRCIRCPCRAYTRSGARPAFCPINRVDFRPIAACGSLSFQLLCIAHNVLRLSLLVPCCPRAWCQPGGGWRALWLPDRLARSLPCMAIGWPYLYLIRSIEKIAFAITFLLAREMIACAHVHQCTCFTNGFVTLSVLGNYRESR
jgi:hypothetical protein